MRVYLRMIASMLVFSSFVPLDFTPNILFATVVRKSIHVKSKDSCIPGLSRERHSRFRGYLVPEHKKFKLPVQIDFFLESNSSFGAVLKVNLGYFGSHEYLSQYYSTVTFDEEKGTILFHSLIWDLNLFGMRLEQGQIKGRFRSNSGLQHGTIRLVEIDDGQERSNLNESFPQQPELKDIKRLPLLSGQYEGVCNGKKTSFQLELNKWFSLSMPVQSPFYGSTVTGRTGVVDGNCNSKDKPCLRYSFFSGTYNPYSGIVRLTGHPKDTVLFSRPPWLIYQGCQLKKTFTLDLASPQINSIDVDRGKGKDGTIHQAFFEDAIPLKPEDQAQSELRPSGMYNGYLYHSQIRRYQRMSVSIESSLTFKTSSKRQYSPIAWLYFSPPELEAGAYLSFPFIDLVLGDHEGNHVWDSKADVIASISKWENGRIEGVWISKSFGVVGPFVVAHEDNAQIFRPREDLLLSEVFGDYQNKSWTLRLTGQGDLLPYDLTNFFPLQLNGDTSAPGVSEQKSVKTGVYDFYTGSLCFLLSDSRLVMGHVNGDDLSLFWPAKPKWGVKLSEVSLQDFFRSSETSEIFYPAKKKWVLAE